ncbi:MAG TPA: hypothetical protein VFG59_03100 [Anaeromyxobacter sp.]|nr:hypothetical protein [Anaeromyxobacter sp.]
MDLVASDVDHAFMLSRSLGDRSVNAWHGIADRDGAERCAVEVWKRHVGATETGRVGASLADLMAFGGWASPRMAQRYSHSDHRRQLEIARRREEARDEAARRDAAQAAMNPSPRPEKETGGRDLSQPPVSTVDPTRIELVTS